MLKIGLEREFFVQNLLGKIVILSAQKDISDDNIWPVDGGGLLLEDRGEPSTNVYQAVFSLRGRIRELIDQISQRPIHRATTDHADDEWIVRADLSHIPKTNSTMDAVRRVAYKGPVKYRNLYSHTNHRKRNLLYAGTHITFSDPQFRSFQSDLTISITKGCTCKRCTNRSPETVNSLFDFHLLFKLLDAEFSTEIREAQRNIGFYELKDDGLVEYRSLPNTVPIMRLAEGLTRVLTLYNKG